MFDHPASKEAIPRSQTTLPKRASSPLPRMDQRGCKCTHYPRNIADTGSSYIIDCAASIELGLERRVPKLVPGQRRWHVYLGKFRTPGQRCWQGKEERQKQEMMPYFSHAVTCRWPLVQVTIFSSGQDLVKIGFVVIKNELRPKITYNHVKPCVFVRVFVEHL